MEHWGLLGAEKVSVAAEGAVEVEMKEAIIIVLARKRNVQ